MTNTTTKTEIRAVWILVIDNKYGTHTSAHRSEEGAKQALYAYCTEWWDEGIDEQYGLLASMNRDDAIDAYFDAWSHAFDAEWYILEPHILED